ncbi:CNH domain-containing protein [Chlamydoabsidia padenii]|nr:CNH domain-containing protein [Chlamydoabsidia padenii]
MPFSPYTLQTLLPGHVIEDIIQSITPNSTSPTASPPSFFSRLSTTPLSPQVIPTNGTSNSLVSSSPPSKGNTRFNTLGNAQHFTIDAVEAWGNILYLGTSDGHILHFTLEEQRGNTKTCTMPYVSRLENKIFLGYGKKSVERILVIPQVSKAVVLCDSTLSFYSLPFFDPLPVSLIPPIKGVSCFTHDAAEEGKIGMDGTIELCVVKRRVLQIYKIGEFLQMKKEIPLHDGAIFVIRYNRNLCLADHNQYKLINVDPINTIPLIPTPQEPTSPSSGILSSHSQLVPRPVAAVIKSDEFLMVSGSASNQTIGIFLDARGNAIRGTMQWSSYPKSICVEYPYIAALLRNNTIEIHNINNQQLLQVIPLETGMEPRGMSFGHGIKVHLDGLAERLLQRPYNMNRGDSDDDGDDDLQVSLKRQVARLSIVPAKILVFGRHSVMAQIITPLVMQVDALIDDNRIEEAMEMTDQARNTMSSTNTIHMERMRSELDYIYQKCGLLMLKETVFDDAFNLLSKGNLDPRLVIHLFGDRLFTHIDDGASRILVFDSISQLLQQISSIDDLVSSNLARNYPDQQNPSSANVEMRRVLLENANEAAQKYLLAERGKRRDTLGQGDSICKAIDTALLKLFTLTNNSKMIYRILKEPNDCDIGECKKALLEAKRYYALSIFYASKNNLKESLDLWIQIYKGKLPDNDFNEGLDKMKDILLDNNELPLHVMMDYTWWLTEQNPTDGVQVLINSPRAADMDPRLILEKLTSFGTEATTRYLEYLVVTRQSQIPEFHTQLACTYVKDIQDRIKQSTTDELSMLVKEFKQSVDPMRPNVDNDTFVGYLGRKQHTHSKLIATRLLLIKLLEQSQIYDPNTVMDSLSEAGPLYIEKTFIYARLGKHQEALDILIHELGDFVGAETYCATNGRSTGIIPGPLD